MTSPCRAPRRSVPLHSRTSPLLRRAWRTGRCLLALLASLHTLAACSAQQPTRSSYERQAEMEDAALAALADERSDHPQADPDESAQPSVANGGAADVMGQIGVALMSVLMTLGNAILPLLMLL